MRCVSTYALLALLLAQLTGCRSAARVCPQLDGPRTATGWAAAESAGRGPTAARSALVTSKPAPTLEPAPTFEPAPPLEPAPVVDAAADDLRPVGFQTTPASIDGGRQSTSETGDDAAWTLEDVERYALEHNPALAVAAAEMRKRRGGHVQAGLYPNPIVGYHAMQIGNLGTSGQQGGFISQRFITGGKLGLDSGITAKEIDEAHALFHAQEQRVLNDVRLRFYDALIATRRLELSQELDQVAERFVQATDRLVEARQLSEDSLLQAEIEAERVHILRDNADNENRESRRRLWAVLGSPGSESHALSGDVEAGLPDYTWEQCLDMLLSNNLELQAARTKIDRLRLTVRRAKREIVPDVDLAVSVRHDNITDYEVANVQLGVAVPIFDRNQGNILRAEAQLAQAIDDVRRRELDLQDRLAGTFRTYDNARRQIARYTQRILPRARRSLQLVSDGYAKGQVDFLTLVTAQRTFVQTSLAYLNSVQEIRRSLTVMEGQLLSGSLR